MVLEHALGKLGHTPVLATSVDQALEVVGRRKVDLVIADYRMPGATGLDLLERLRRERHAIPVIIMTGYSSIEHAVESIKAGAIDYLTKPVRIETLEIVINQVMEVVRLRRQNETYRNEITAQRVRRAIVGDSAVLQRVLDTVATVAPTRATVLIEGESGTGKELLARAIHDQGARADHPFVSINCAALPEGLVESVLFGHEKGAFTGATVKSAGAFERADGGTLLLDEISEMRLDLQAKLLRVLQEQEFERVGGQTPVRVDVRVIATTNRNLKAEADTGRFRSDLYYRLNVMPIKAPPLRERASDIPALVQHFAHRTAEQMGTPVPPILAETLERLQAYRWPGNVRELANAVERAVILAGNGPLGPGLFQLAGWAGDDAGTGSAGTPESLPLNLHELEQMAITRALEQTGGNRAAASRLLGISERTLRNRLNR